MLPSPPSLRTEPVNLALMQRLCTAICWESHVLHIWRRVRLTALLIIGTHLHWHMYNLTLDQHLILGWVHEASYSVVNHATGIRDVSDRKVSILKTMKTLHPIKHILSLNQRGFCIVKRRHFFFTIQVQDLVEFYQQTTTPLLCFLILLHRNSMNVLKVMYWSKWMIYLKGVPV